MNNEVAAQSTGQILRGIGDSIHGVPDTDFLRAMKELPQRMAARLAFMSGEHHMVRDFVVREMPRQSRPISADAISRILGLSLKRVNELLGELEMHLFFLVRDRKGNVTWAFPVTTSHTEHRLTFSTGEVTFGA